MIKFLIILSLIFGFFVIGTGMILRKVRKIFSPVSNTFTNPQSENKDILYQKDDVVVLKGEAKR